MSVLGILQVFEKSQLLISDSLSSWVNMALRHIRLCMGVLRTHSQGSGSPSLGLGVDAGPLGQP